MSFFVPSRFSLGTADGGGRDTFADVLAHEFPKHQCRRTIMNLTRSDEFVPQIPAQPDAHSNIFLGHASSVTNGYTSAQRSRSTNNGDLGARVSSRLLSHIPT